MLDMYGGRDRGEILSPHASKDTPHKVVCITQMVGVWHSCRVKNTPSPLLEMPCGQKQREGRTL